ncbi:hypothetical protein H4219_006062 [Mycoemilia scoparia]|uniref:alpha-1,2-Mannosidase n=1 Tax=Mycoemilia scoparia TaxID=417184 RepID=A0A9W8DJS3_9FUNG|nr:hypothetical protein H4219_006062 [Mycoemilia scoparia]
MSQVNLVSHSSGAQSPIIAVPRSYKHLAKRGFLLVVLCLVGYLILYCALDNLDNRGNGGWTGTPHPKPPSNGDGWDRRNAKRREAVKDAMKHAWRGYRSYAFGKDELMPLTRNYTNKWGGWGVSLIDALDTLYIMGLKDEFDEARDFALSIDFTKTIPDFDLPFFEMTIRSLGGLLSAYELSADPRLKDKCKEVGDVLAIAFNSPTGIPYPRVNVTGMKPVYDIRICIAEAGTVQMEFQKLSEITGDPSYRIKAQKVVDILDKLQKPYPGLYPFWIDIYEETFSGGQITFGGMADSWYEYLLKQYLLNNKKKDQYRRMYVESIEGMKDKLVRQSVTDPSMFYVGEMDATASYFDPKFEHLTCFLPGLLALGAKELDRLDDLDLAKKIMKTCFKLYDNSPTGLSPEWVKFSKSLVDFNAMKENMGNLYGLFDMDSDNNGKISNSGYFYEDTRYLLRPETVESLFILHRITGDEVYREWGWRIFMAIEKYTKTPVAYAAYIDVLSTDKKNKLDDSMERQAYITILNIT